ncbi:uncharacterized protein BN487_01690 [Prevotella sp. CAG:1320]|nr:uncharacterized protein BN487_01690 [Prevotella sp. CAG:1320]
MKKLTTYILCLLAGGSAMLTSCDLEADSISSMDAEVVFNTEALADAAVMAVHQSFGQTNSYRGRYITYYGMNTDAEVWRAYGDFDNPANDRDASLSVYAAQPDNSYMNTSNNMWNYMYEAIERINKAVESMEEYSDLTNANMRQLYGELLTLRAYIYFDLVKTWGDVPYRFEPNTSDNVYLPRTDRTVILQKLVDDLGIAEDYVGWPNENSYTQSVERVSKTFTKGLRARIALFLAGKSYYPNEGVRYNLQDEAARREMYQIAYDECSQVIAQQANTLATDFKTYWKSVNEEQLAAGGESVYEMPFSDGRGRVSYSWGTRHTTDSKNPASKQYDQWTQLMAGGRGAPSQTLWYDYDPEDTRREVTCVPYVWRIDGTCAEMPASGAAEAYNEAYKLVSGGGGGGWSFGKYRMEWMTRKITSTNDDGINWVIMRYSDIYLMAAEAANELGDLNGAKSYLEPILSRSLPSTKVNEILAAATNHDSFFRTIVEQRKLEFAGEQLRKTDLIRWGLLKTKLDETSDKMSALADRQSITTDYGTYDYSQYSRKLYYEIGLGAASDDADGYTIFGLNPASSYGLADGTAVDEYGKENYSESSTWFAYRTLDEGGEDEDESSDTEQAVTDHNNSVNNYINNLYVYDPEANMFWPIWQVFINGSNGQLTNDGYLNH